jgi:predicted TIM-barrel fold metal-dependent hydrolase
MKEYYSAADFIKIPKYDAHTHYHIADDLLIRKAEKVNLRILTINTDLGFIPLDTQFEISQSLHRRHPQAFNFIGTFDASTFASETFAEDTLGQIKRCMAAGAKGIKIWKNIGMSLKKETGQYLMADDPVFDPIYAFLEKEKIPLLAHLGEPRNCWLPLEEMTTCNDRIYFGSNPDYHMYHHPEIPGYERQMEARDHLLERYPNLIFIGAHLGSMDWNLNEVAKRLDRFPNFYVDFSARLMHIFEQTLRNRNGVIDFFQTYQNRLLYGLDTYIALCSRQKWMNLFCRFFPLADHYLLYRYLYGEIRKHWLFLATDQMIKTGQIMNHPDSPKCIRGLKLKKAVMDRIFFENAIEVYGR